MQPAKLWPQIWRRVTPGRDITQMGSVGAAHDVGIGSRSSLAHGRRSKHHIGYRCSIADGCGESPFGSERHTATHCWSGRECPWGRRSSTVAKPPPKKGTLSALAIAVIAGVVLIGSIASVQYFRHRGRVHAQEEAEKQKETILAHDRAKADEIAKQAASKTEAALTPADANALASNPGTQPTDPASAKNPSASNSTPRSNSTSAAGAKISDTSIDKKNAAKTPATRGTGKPSTPVSPASGSEFSSCVAAGYDNTAGAGPSACCDDSNTAAEHSDDECLRAGEFRSGLTAGSSEAGHCGTC